jgi:hypothetical protein
VKLTVKPFKDGYAVIDESVPVNDPRGPVITRGIEREPLVDYVKRLTGKE